MTVATTTYALSHPRAIGLEIDADVPRVTVADGRTTCDPLAWFGWLAAATGAQRHDLAIIGGGAGIWWEELDEGLSVPGLFGLAEDL